MLPTDSPSLQNSSIDSAGESADDALLVEIRMMAVWGSGDPSIVLHDCVTCWLDLEAGKPAVEQLDRLRRFRASVLKTLEDLLARFPDRKQGPTIYLSGNATYHNEQLEGFGLSMESTDPRGHTVRTRGKEKLCENAVEIVKEVESRLQDSTDGWFSSTLLAYNA